MTGNKAISWRIPVDDTVSLYERIGEIILGTVFLVSGLQHLSNPFIFYRAVANYRLVEPELCYMIAALLPMLQVTVAFLLLFSILREGSRLISFILLSGFLFAQSSALVRGLDIECGCFGSGKSNISWYSILFVAGLLILNGFLVVASFRKANPGRPEWHLSQSSVAALQATPVPGSKKTPSTP